MLRFVRTSPRPILRSSLARPSPIAQLQPYNSSPYLRSFHSGEFLQQVRPVLGDDELEAIREKVKEKVALPKLGTPEKVPEKIELEAYEAREYNRQYDKALKNHAAPKLKEKKKQEGVAKQYDAYLELMEKKAVKKGGLRAEVDTDRAAIQDAVPILRKEEKDKKAALRLQAEKRAEKRAEKKKEKAAFRVEAVSKPTVGLAKQGKKPGKKSKKAVQSTSDTGIDNDTEKKSFPKSDVVGAMKAEKKTSKNSVGKEDIEPESGPENTPKKRTRRGKKVEESPADGLRVNEVYSSNGEFLKSIGVGTIGKQKSRAKKRLVSDLQDQPTGEVEGTGNDIFNEAAVLSTVLERKPLGHGSQIENVKVAKMPTLKSLPKVSKPLEMEYSEETKKLVQELDNVWKSTNPNTGRRLKDHTRKRINIVSGELCDDILERMKPSLIKHMGCDILDLNPGSCVWSSKLHELLKPRTHVLMENDMETYDPYMQPLLNAPNSTYKLCAKPPLVWSEMESVLNKDFFPFQEAHPKGDPRLNEPNDSMLVLVNLAHHPKQSYRGFPSIAPLVMYQLMSAIGSHALFQKYGLVRMLFWVADDEREAVLPRHVSFRRKSTVENEVSCTITEVASSTRPAPIFRRDAALEISMTRKILDKMAEQDIKIPRGRESIIQEHILNNPDNAEEVGDVLEVDRKGFRYLHELAELEAESEASPPSAKSQLGGGKTSKTAHGERNRLTILRNRQEFRTARKHLVDEFVSRHKSIYKEQAALHGVEGEEAQLRREKLKELRLDLLHEIESQRAKETKNRASTSIDNARTVYNEDHLLFQYDRREFEPLRVYKEEFYPHNVELSLLDIKPHPLWPVLQNNYPQNLDVFQHILTVMFALPMQGVKQALLSLWPGAYEYLIHECPSLVDARVGGDPNLDLLPVRILPLQCFKEIMEAWDRWPFRPSREDLLVHGSMWENDFEKEKAIGKSGHP